MILKVHLVISDCSRWMVKSLKMTSEESQRAFVDRFTVRWTGSLMVKDLVGRLDWVGQSVITFSVNVECVTSARIQFTRTALDSNRNANRTSESISNEAKDIE